MSEAAILLQILRLPGIGPAKLRLLLARLFQLGVPIERITELSDEQLALGARLKGEQIAALRHPASDAEEDLHQCADKGIRTLLPADSDYPLRLITLLKQNAPPLLFVRGNLTLLNYPCLGISGARKATEESLAATHKLSQSLSQHGWVIASGGARGADEAAHLGSLQSGGPGTIVVMPTGILKPNIRGEMRKHLEDGRTLLLSEFPPEFGWTVGCAMQRNRLLIALSSAAVLIEPGITGGTGGTGKIALRLGLPLFVLETPAGIGAGGPDLVKAGAQILNLGRRTAAQVAHLFEEAGALAGADRERGITPSLFTS
jgi:DNA protecting protein DprA